MEFEYLVQGADAFGRPLIVKRSSRNAGAGTTNYARTDHIAYEDNHAVWVLGQERQSTNADTGLIERRTIFDARAQPTHRHAFEKLQQVLTYDAWGNLATASDGRDSPDVDTTIVYSQWKRGIPQRITFPDGYTRNAVVDAHGQVRSIDDEVGNRTCYDFDAMGRLKQITYPSDTQLHVCDDSRWNASVRKIEKASASEVGLPAGHWKETTTTGTGVHVTRYDALWRPVVVERFDSDDKPGTLTQTVRRYTANGQVAFESYPLRGMTQYTSVGTGTRTTFDALGRATRVEQDSDEGPLLTRYAYQAGFITEATRPDGRVTRTGYQAYDKPSTELVRAIVYPEGIASDIPRDVFGKPAYITRRSLDHSQSMVRTYAYNPAQELCRTVEPETGATLVGYDAAGNVAWSASGLPGATPCEPEGTSPSVVARRSERRYDGRNRLVELTFADDIGEQRWAYTPDGLPSGAWTYNGAGRTELVYNAWSYNSRRLLGGAGETLHEPGWTWALGYGYDRNGSMTVRYNPDTSSHLFTVNGLGQVIGIRGTSGNYVSDARYHPNGALQRFTYGNGIAHTTEQNTRGMPDRTRDAHGAVAVIDDGYDYDLVGNVVAISDGASGRNQRGNRTMAYDGLDRLTAVSSPMFTAARYEYDVFDNLKRVTIGGTFGRDHYYCHDANNRLTNIKTMGCGSGASVVGLGHDVQGNVRNKNGVQYVFSHDNRLREVVGKESYHYDARGLRSTAESATLGKTRSFYNKAGQVAFQSDGRRQVSLANVYLAGRLVATCEQSLVTTVATMKYLHTDALGTPVAVTDAAGNVVERSEYEPYGRLLNRPIQDGVGYTGHVEDAQTGLTHMQQRYYDPAGVFLSVDPVAASSTNGMNFNRYWYANNNPYRYIDPDGRVSDDPDRQARGGLSVGQATSPAADKVVSDRGGAPTGKLAVQMESTDPKDRLAIAKTAMATGQINGDPETLSYNPDLQGIASGTTDPSGAVEVGPDAFVSWSWLESTLGHEYEIHVPQFQNFGPIRSDRDNSRREAEAHQYNLNNAARFRNTPGEIQRYQELLQQDKGG